jgi:predicted ATPase
MSWELRAALSLSRLKFRQGERATARQTLSQVVSQFTEGFETGDLRQARDLLSELSLGAC